MNMNKDKFVDLTVFAVVLFMLSMFFLAAKTGSMNYLVFAVCFPLLVELSLRFVK